jgi:hypothetical protein
MHQVTRRRHNRSPMNYYVMASQSRICNDKGGDGTTPPREASHIKVRNKGRIASVAMIVIV